MSGRTRIVLASPARAGAPSGNGSTAARWRQLWTSSGHEVRVTTTAAVTGADVLVALHATKCKDAIDAWRAVHATRPLIVAVSGTDMHGTAQRRFRRSLDMADAIVVLQPLALESLSKPHRKKARCILQSVPKITRTPPREDVFEIAVVAGLRRVKDPLRAAHAVKRVPATSKLVVTHYGPALDEAFAQQATRLMRACDRYHWHGSQSRTRTHALLGRARALCLSSRSEGGANVLSEAIAAGLPVICSHIPGNLGILGPDWPATFPAGDTIALRDELVRFEQDAAHRDDLEVRIQARAASVRPETERKAWRDLFDSLR